MAQPRQHISNDPREKDRERLKRIDENLMVLRDKIDTAERLPGTTRSDLLLALSGDTEHKPLAEAPPPFPFFDGPAPSISTNKAPRSFRLLGVG